MGNEGFSDKSVGCNNSDNSIATLVCAKILLWAYENILALIIFIIFINKYIYKILYIN